MWRAATARIGDKLELVSPQATRTGECLGVGNLGQPNQPNTQRRLVGVLVSGLKEEDVSPGDALQAVGGGALAACPVYSLPFARLIRRL